MTSHDQLAIPVCERECPATERKGQDRQHYHGSFEGKSPRAILLAVVQVAIAGGG